MSVTQARNPGLAKPHPFGAHGILLAFPVSIALWALIIAMLF
jgi:F0F1-type ATP synthase membrane subunit c/vacuolar-type H+-ATPase subunit K